MARGNEEEEEEEEEEKVRTAEISSRVEGEGCVPAESAWRRGSTVFPNPTTPSLCNTACGGVWERDPHRQISEIIIVHGCCLIASFLTAGRRTLCECVFFQRGCLVFFIAQSHAEQHEFVGLASTTKQQQSRALMAVHRARETSFIFLRRFKTYLLTCVATFEAERALAHKTPNEKEAFFVCLLML